MVVCNFCANKIETNKEIVIQSSCREDVYICEECIRTCFEIIEANSTMDDEFEINQNSTIKTPKELYNKLNDFIIGQDNAKKVLSVAIFNHYKRINNLDLNIEKSNILVVGPTGTGKTHTIKTIAKILDIPFASADATSITESGSRKVLLF